MTKKNFSVGDDLLTKERQIASSDSIIVFFTPSYKDKVLSKDNSKGAYREYKIIKQRLENGDNNIIPVLVSGNMKKSVPSEFTNIIYEDIRKIRTQVFDNHGITLSEDLKNSLHKIAREAIKKTQVYSWLKDNSFDSLEDEYRALFLNTSADSNAKLPRNCIIKTEAYDFIMNQLGYFVIGRKGGGKTTLLEAIQQYNPTLYMQKYKKGTAIKAESIILSNVYEKLIVNTKNDFSIISMTKVIDVFWEVFFVLQCIYNIGIELENFCIDESDERIDTFRNTVEKLKHKLGNDESALDDKASRDSISILASELLVNYWNNEIFNTLNISTVSTSAYNNFSSEKILQLFLGKKLFLDFCRAIRRCSKKILLALDGFDPHSDGFRTNTFSYRETDEKEYIMRKNFEVLFYREMMITVSNLKNSDISNCLDMLFASVDFCIIIPQDRYDEIKDYDRDIAKREYCRLNWDAYDLLNMLVKRLEHYYKLEPSKNFNILDRFNEIIKKEISSIPTNIKIEIDGRNHSMSLFSYILRLSFWRPRDIIKHFAVIMKLSKSELVQSEETVLEIMKALLIDNTRKIIDEEFIGEYKYVYGNLNNALHQFEGANLINEIADFYQKLNNTSINSLYIDSTNNVHDKFQILYKLGVVGLYLDKMRAKNYGYGHHICFVFNEGLQPFYDMIQTEHIRAKVIFNPIFLKYLSLNINTNELICDYDWNYIFKNHLMKDTIRRI